VSTHRYPQYGHLQLEAIVDLLLQAPKITREVAAMNWQFVDAPPDGTIMLIWQPPQLGTHSATDGLVYYGPEAAFSSEVRGYVSDAQERFELYRTDHPQTVEMYYHRTGYHPPRETVATHARRRYRLMPSATPNPNVSPPESSLWIIHYSQAEPPYQLPSNRVPINAQIQTAMTQRRYLQQHGQLVRKEFMLHDRNNWPTINLPNGSMPQPWNPNSNYPSNVISQMSRSHQSYMMQQQAASHAAMGPSPAKRQRQVGPPHGHGPSRSQMPMIPNDSSVEEEETINSDAMDTLTPRDISANRYIQHHLWMEEIFSSPYGTSQIVPVELGLGRRGEIESLTREFFDAPMSGEANKIKGAVPPRVGRLEDGKAKDFTAKAAQRIAQLNAEMEKLKRQHAKRTEKLSRGDVVKEAEQKMRDLSVDKRESDNYASSTDEVVNLIEKVQAFLGQGVRVIKEVECVQRGGLEEKAQANEANFPQHSFDMDHPALDAARAQAMAYQMPKAGSGRGFDSTGQTPQAYPQSATPSDRAQDAEPAKVTASEDVTMSEVPTGADSKEGGSGDWIMVDKEGESGPADNQERPDVGTLASHATLENEFATSGNELDTAGDALQDFAPDQGTMDEFHPDDFNDTVDFGGLDTAGDGLSGFAEQANVEMALEEPGDLGLDDSAFGEAFHAPEAGEQPETGGAEPRE